MSYSNFDTQSAIDSLDTAYKTTLAIGFVTLLSVVGLLLYYIVQSHPA